MIAKKELNALIKAELLARVTRRLLDLGFRPMGRPRRGKLPFRYWRETKDRIDLLEFQWDKYNRPHFVINFRPVEHHADIERFEANPRENWDQLYTGYFRAGDGGAFGNRWFKLSLLARAFYPSSAISRLVDRVEKRVIEIDEFLGGGKQPRAIREIRSHFDLNDWPHEFFQPPLLFTQQPVQRKSL